jgi:RNA polymerase sigma factor (sigma-70 family)
MHFARKLSDKKLAEALKNRDEEALIQLYNDNYTVIRNFVLRHQGNEQDAEDLLLEAVMVVWDNIIKPDFALTSKLSTYVFAIVKRKWWKMMGKHQKLTYDTDGIGDIDIPDDPHLQRESQTLVLQLLQELEDGCKDLLSLFYLQELPTKIIAQKLQLANADVVKSKKYQCMKKLQHILQKKYPEFNLFR